MSLDHLNLTQHAIWGIVEAYVSCGTVDLSEVDDERVIRASLRAFNEEREAKKQESSDDEKGLLVCDHSSNLLSKADEFLEEHEYNFAILFYATWLEHWINDMIITLGARRNVSEDISVTLVRSCNFNLKVKDVWRSLEAPPLEREVIRDMSSLMEWRNGFVHYKWKPESDAEWEVRKEKSRSVANTGKRLVESLQHISDEVLFHGRKDSLMKKVCDMWPEESQLINP